MTRIHRPGLALLSALVLHTAPLAAQEETFKFELTPFAAYRMGGSFEEKDTGARVALHDSSAQGITFNIKANPNPDIDLDVETFHFGGTYLFDGENTRPFIALTIGVSQFDPGIVDSGSESFFSASLGAGVQLNATRRLGFRLEARAFTTFVEDDSNIFCASSGGAGGCLIQVDARTLTQWEARAGLVFRF
jgi:hypothetical protein